MEFPQKDEVGFTTNWLTLTFALIGFCLILASLAIPEGHGLIFFRHILRELGVVVSAVFTVSLLYERLIAKKHIQQFLDLLRGLIEKGESNAAICARLGIIKIFLGRDAFEREYPISELLNPVDDLRIRVVAQTLYQLMNRAGAIKRAMEHGALVELCMFNPSSSQEEFDKHPDLLVFDLQSAVLVFARDIAAWANATQPKGQIELRFHQVPIFDSMLLAQTPDQGLLVWDLGFGRDRAEKCILLIDPVKSLGIGLIRRYEHVWNNATTVFKYEGQQIVTDELSNHGIHGFLTAAAASNKS